MKYLCVIGGLSVLLLAGGCDGSSQQRDSPEKIMDDPMKQQETDQDTTLQEVEEITIRTVGFDDLQTVNFDTDTLQVKKGSLVRLEFVNEGKDPKMIYNIVFVTEGQSERATLQSNKAGASGNYLPDSSIMLAASPLALPGQTVKMEFKAPDEPGTYDFVNTYPSESDGMRGKLIVQK